MPQTLRNKLSAVSLSSLRTKNSSSNLSRRHRSISPIASCISPIRNSCHAPTLESQIEKRRALDPWGPTFDAIIEDGFFFRPSDTISTCFASTSPVADDSSATTIDSSCTSTPASLFDASNNTESAPQMTEPVPARHRSLTAANALHSHPPTPRTRSQSAPTVRILQQALYATQLNPSRASYEVIEILPGPLPSGPSNTAHVQASWALEALSDQEKEALCGVAAEARIKRKPVGGRARGATVSGMGLVAPMLREKEETQEVKTAVVRGPVEGYIVGVGFVSRVLVR